MWKRVPTRWEHGERLSDFLMLIPGLRSRPAPQLQQTLESIHHVLAHYRHAVVFADINLRLNLLWVSVRPLPGISVELAAAVQAYVPEAKLVANRAQIIVRERTRSHWWRRSPQS